MLTLMLAMFQISKSIAKSNNLDVHEKTASTSFLIYSPKGLHERDANFIVNSSIFSAVARNLDNNSFLIRDIESAFIYKLQGLLEATEHVQFNDLLQCNSYVCMGSFAFKTENEVIKVFEQLRSDENLRFSLISGFVENKEDRQANFIFHYKSRKIINENPTID